MKRYIYILLICLAAITGTAQTAQERQAIERISRSAAAMKSMQADFVQTKHLKMLGEKMVSTGRMRYRQSDKLRWEYTSPYAYTFILNGNSVLMKKGNRSDVVDVNRNKMFREIARIMMSSVVGDCLTDKKSFKVSMTTARNTCTATLIPQKKELKAVFTRIVLTFDSRTSMVTKVTMYEKNGDRTEIVLKNAKANTAINAAEFAVK
ncbi:MAG: outer membrane lipoprotein carrier protein LolA [Prevotella sp.]|nr:outer membrane lipoprotein carrier protein LolA [Prevotella sp.]